jgi:serine protease Do
MGRLRWRWAAGIPGPMLMLGLAVAGVGGTKEPAAGDGGIPSAFGREAPRGVGDLEVMQAHFIALAARVAPATVRLRGAKGGRGTGVLVRRDGLVLSARHVTGDPGAVLSVILTDGRTLRAEVVAADPASDLSLLQVADGRDLPNARLGRADLRPGAWCIALGYPGGVGYPEGESPPPSVRVGRVVRTPGAPDRHGHLVVTDCPIEGGDSGGPLFDLEGRVVGIHGKFWGMDSADNGHIPSDVALGLWGERLDAGRRGGDR